MRKVNESKAWTGLSQAYAAHFGDPDSIWRIDNKHGTGMADVFMCLPAPTWIELKTGYDDLNGVNLYHPLSKPQLGFLQTTSCTCISGMLVMLDDHFWRWYPTSTLTQEMCGAKRIEKSSWVFAPGGLRMVFFPHLAQSSRGR